MQPAVQHSLPQAVGFRCAHCTSEFDYTLIHVTPWTVIAESNPPLELDALIQATASPFLLLDVQVFHRQSLGNMIF
jgi:hypothetical protein